MTVAQATAPGVGALPEAPPARHALTALAWGAALTPGLTSILWQVFVGTRPPLWVDWLLSGSLLALCALALRWPWLKPLRGFLLALLALVIGEILLFQILRTGGYTTWAEAAPWGPRWLATSALQLIPTLLVALTVLGSGLRREDLFLVKGTPRAAVQPNRLLRTRRPWTRESREFLLWFGLGVLIFMGLTLRPDLTRVPQALPHLPFALAAAAINASCEEFRLRAVPLARLVPALGPQQALWLTSVFFGLVHWSGYPSGPIGVLMATFFGWFLGKSMLETRGCAVAVPTHFLMNSLQYTVLALVAA